MHGGLASSARPNGVTDRQDAENIRVPDILLGANQMAHVTVHYEMYIPAAHHRQPRNTGALLDLAPAAGADVPNPGSYTPPYFPQLPYTYGGGSGLAKLLFWSVTDGISGQVLPPVPLSQTVTALPLQIGAWYFPISGPGGGGGGGSAILVDAFSARLGGFIDDTFVDVTSDPTLTGNANVAGMVPTNSPETLKANAAVTSTPEPFSQWVLNDALMPAGSDNLYVPQGTDGIAVAVYQQHSSIIPKLPWEAIYDPWWWIETHGGRVPPGPPPPWIQELAPVFALARATTGLSRKLQIAALKIALEQLSVAADAMKHQIKSLQGGAE